VIILSILRRIKRLFYSLDRDVVLQDVVDGERAVLDGESFGQKHEMLLQRVFSRPEVVRLFIYTRKRINDQRISTPTKRSLPEKIKSFRIKLALHIPPRYVNSDSRFTSELLKVFVTSMFS
jgi:hypothetical protein